MAAVDVRPDNAALRAARRARVLAEMNAAGIDVLILGREPNARYVAGVPRLWIAGSRPFGPGCVIERATGSVHLVSTWDEGVPDDIPHENLHGITFNGANTLAWLAKVEGAATAKVVATDGLMPSSVQLVTSAFPAAELVDGEGMMRRIRSTKMADEVEAIRAAVGVAEHSFAVAEKALSQGITERQLTAVFMEAMAESGVTTPTTQDVAWITSRSEPWARSHRDVAVAPGDLVVFEAGVRAGGYVGEVGRTRCVDGLSASVLRPAWNELWDRLMDACRPGAPASDLLAAYDACGVPRPPMPVARGLGLGNDLPLVTRALTRTARDRLEPGMVLALTAYVWREGVGALYGQDPVHITEAGPQLLSTTPFREEA